jgi:ABC-type sugar transport system ATPase subunit
VNDYLLELVDIRKSFGNNQILKGVNLKIKTGEIHGLIGKNGAGKSTLMKILYGVIPKESGNILLRGNPIEINSVKQARNHRISMVYQDLSLFPNLSVAENIFMGRFRENGLSKFGIIDENKLYRETKCILDRLHFPIDIHLKVGQLGLGQQYMVEIARIFSQQADLLILDEPTAALNEQEVSYFLQVLREVQNQGITIIYISHRLKEIKEIAQSITIIRDGMDVASLPVNTVESEEIIKLMVGEEALGRYPKLGLPAKKEILRIEGLSLGSILNDISFSVHEGEILGIAGLAGSGRTALMESIFGATSQAKGRTFLRGREIKIKSPGQAIKMGFAYLAEDRVEAGLFNNLSVKSNIVSSNLSRVSQNSIINLIKEHQLGMGLAKRLGMHLYNVQQIVSTLSGGNQQKTLLAKWLFSGSYVYLLDEPTHGLDIAAKVDIYNILNSLICGGSGIIMVSSDLSELIGMCHRVLVMFNGRIMGEAKGADISEERILKMASGRE